MNLQIRTPDSLGCSVAGSSVIHSLRQRFPKSKITIFTNFPKLFQGITKSRVIEPSISTNRYDVDLRKYTSRRPHNASPYRPSYVHMIEMAEEQLGIELPRTAPRLELSNTEINWALREVYRFGKPVVWFQSKTNSPNRDWPSCNWQKLTEQLGDYYSFVDLCNAGYDLRQSLALTYVSSAGICLDSFLVHGSWAVGAKRVLVILGSSRPECVTYPGQKVLYVGGTCCAQPCGMHGYTIGCKAEDEAMFANTGRKFCTHARYQCMEAISVSSVKRILNEMTSHSYSSFIEKHTNNAVSPGRSLVKEQTEKSHQLYAPNCL